MQIQPSKSTAARPVKSFLNFLLALIGVLLLLPGVCAVLSTPLLFLEGSDAFATQGEFAGGAWLWLGGLAAGALGLWLRKKTRNDAYYDW